MKIIDVIQGSDEWLNARKGKIGGTALGDLYSKYGKRKIGFYEVLAGRLAVDPDDEDRRERGLRLEETVVELFEKQYKKKIERVGICISDENPNIYNSPDGLIKNNNKYTEAVEIKCLSSARHLQVVVENKVPSEFIPQCMQYAIVNPDLKTLYVVFYDDRIISKPLHIIEINRKDIEDEILLFKDFQLEQLKELDKLTEELSW